MTAPSGHRQLHRLIGKQGIQATVNRFYEQIGNHPTLGGYFKQVRDWDELKTRIGHFWWIDLGGDRYRDDVYNPHAVHRHLQVPPELIDDWLELFRGTLESGLQPEHATLWFERAQKMAGWVRFELEQQANQNSQVPT